MTDRERSDDLGALFVAVTGRESVVEPQARDAPTRELPTDRTPPTDSSSYHGLEDAIDAPDGATDGPA